LRALPVLVSTARIPVQNRQGRSSGAVRTTLRSDVAISEPARSLSVLPPSLSGRRESQAHELLRPFSGCIAQARDADAPW